MSQCVTRGPLFLRGQWKLWFIPHLSPLQLHNQSSGMSRSALSSSWGMGLGHKSYIRQSDTFLTLSVTEIAFIYFLQPENHRLTLIWNDTTLNETKLTPYYTVQCLNVNNQSYLVFVDTFRSVQLNSVDVEVIVTSTEEVMLSVCQQYYRETAGPSFMKLGGRL